MIALKNINRCEKKTGEFNTKYLFICYILQFSDDRAQLRQLKAYTRTAINIMNVRFFVLINAREFLITIFFVYGRPTIMKIEPFPPSALRIHKNT